MKMFWLEKVSPARHYCEIEIRYLTLETKSRHQFEQGQHQAHVEQWLPNCNFIKTMWKLVMKLERLLIAGPRCKWLNSKNDFSCSFLKLKWVSRGNVGPSILCRTFSTNFKKRVLRKCALQPTRLGLKVSSILLDERETEKKKNWA